MATFKKTRGRDKFRKYRILIIILIKVLKCVPKKVLKLLWSFTDLFSGNIGVGIRYGILKIMARECGENIYIGPNVEIRAWEKLTIGNNVSIHRSSYIDAEGFINIGNDVSIAHHSSLISFEHTWDNNKLPIRENPAKFKPINIESDVWIGCGCRILSGTTIESRSIVAAGAVVNSKVNKNTIVGGVPAKVIKEI